MIARNLSLIGLLFLLACRTEPVSYEAEKSVVYQRAAVVTPHPLASDIGKEVLERGGNAVDAAVAVQFAIAVVFPRAGNIGGGGFMMIRDSTETVSALDYRERAPGAAGRDMYLDSSGAIIEGLSTKGHLASGVPGTVAGLATAHDRYGRLPWRELVQPAIDLARKGFPISETEAERLNRYRDQFLEFNDPSIAFVREGAWEANQVLRQPELATTLERIRDQKAAGFYTGETAALIAAEMKQGGGLISLDDLANYEAAWRDPIRVTYRDYVVWSMPPTSSGGVALGQLLQLVEPFDLRTAGFHSTRSVHVMAEAMRRVYADRAAYLGDMDFYPVPVDSLLDTDYLRTQMADFRIDSVTASQQLASGPVELRKESFETTHTSIIDQEGQTVSVTTTINSNYGSKVVVDGAGFFLNNEMDDFSSKPGVPNQFGLIGAEANAIEPGKRMLSSMTPTIVEHNGATHLVLGAPGGSTIITAVFQVVMNTLEFGLPLDSAVHAPRFHHQWLPDRIQIEREALSPAVRDSLEALGHTFHEVNRMAIIKAIIRLPDGRLHAVGDWRNPDDDVAGW